MEIAAPQAIHHRAGDHAGAARLLRELVREGLAPDALEEAAGLVLALDRAARERERPERTRAA
jgi:hypothetical protein